MNCENSHIFTTYFTCDFTEENVHVRWNARPLDMPEELHENILDHWNGLPKDHIFNGKLARLESWQLANSHCDFELRPSDYQTLLYSNAHARHICATWGRDYLARTLGISAVLLGADDQLVLMKRSAAVGEYPDCYDVFGGHIDVPDNGRVPNVFASMAQELHEEVGLERHEYALKLIGLVEATPNQKPELIFRADSVLTSAEIVSRTREAKDNTEFSQVHTIGNHNDKIRNFLTEHMDDFSPSAFAAFCVYLKTNRHED